LYINADTIRKAKEIGLNLSKVSENALKDAVRRMSEPKGETMHNGGAENGAKWTGGYLRLIRCKSAQKPNWRNRSLTSLFSFYTIMNVGLPHSLLWLPSGEEFLEKGLSRTIAKDRYSTIFTHG
jgi:hypothetical protein